MIKKILKYIMTIMILGCIVGLVSYKCVNLYIERTYGSVKADALTKNDFFKENKELLSKNKEPIEYVYDNNYCGIFFDSEHSIIRYIFLYNFKPRKDAYLQAKNVIKYSIPLEWYENKSPIKQ